MTTYFSGVSSINKSINNNIVKNEVLGIQSDGDNLILYETNNPNPNKQLTEEDIHITTLPISSIESAMQLFETYNNDIVLDDIDLKDRLMLDFELEPDDIHNPFDSYSNDPLNFLNSNKTTSRDFLTDLFNYHEFVQPQEPEINIFVSKKYNPKYKPTRKKNNSKDKLKLKKNKTSKLNKKKGNKKKGNKKN